MELIEGKTKIGTVRSKAEDKEYDLYYGNVVYKNGETKKVANEVYQSRWKAFYDAHREEVDEATKKIVQEAERRKQKEMEATQQIPVITDDQIEESVKENVDESTEEKQSEDLSDKSVEELSVELPEDLPDEKQGEEPSDKSGEDLAEELHEESIDKSESESVNDSKEEEEAEVKEPDAPSISKEELENIKAEIKSNMDQSIADMKVQIGESLNKTNKSIEDLSSAVAKANKRVKKEIKAEENGGGKYKAVMIASLIVSLLSLGCVCAMGVGLAKGMISLTPVTQEKSTVSVITVNKDIASGTQITEDDVEETEISADEYSELETGTLVGADGSTSKNYAELWGAKNKIVGRYATQDLKQGDYLYKTSYTAIGEGEKVITMDIDGEKVSVPVTITKEGTSDINVYAIMTTKDADGKTSNIAFDLGKISLSGKEIKDITDSSGTSKLAEILKEAEKNTATAEAEAKSETKTETKQEDKKE